MKSTVKRRNKPRIKSNNKNYSLKDSPLYNLKSKKRLLSLLMVKSISDLEALAVHDNYRVFYIEKSEGKKREIQAPKYSLDVIQTRIASLLVRISVPDYLHSGVKGRSSVTNARVHIGCHPVLTMDIKNFYPSVSKKSMYYFFLSTMKTSPDVAGILAALCSYEDHIPTGSRISMPLSFWSNIRMYTELDKLSEKYGITMSAYVDDLTFSGENVNKLFSKHAQRIIEDSGMVVHPDKTRLYARKESKLITGVIVSESGMSVRNKHHKAIYSLFNEIESVKDDLVLEKMHEQIIGRLHAAGQIDPKFKQRAKTLFVS
jgi:hypothetical protein